MFDAQSTHTGKISSMKLSDGTSFDDIELVADPTFAKPHTVSAMGTNPDKELFVMGEVVGGLDCVESSLKEDSTAQSDHSLIEQEIGAGSMSENSPPSTIVANDRVESIDQAIDNYTIDNDYIDNETDFLDWKLEEPQDGPPKYINIAEQNLNDSEVDNKRLTKSESKISSRSRSGSALDRHRVQYPYETFDMIFSSAYGPDGRSK